MEREQLLHLAKLSGFSLTETEIDMFSADMEGIIAFMDTIQETTSEEKEYRGKIFFQDIGTGAEDETLEYGRLLMNAKETCGGFFTAPKVVKE